MSPSLGWVRRRARAAGLVVLAAVAGAGSAAAQGWHEDARFGFKLMPPRGWKPIPLKSNENWLVAKFLCDQKDRWTDDNGGWTWEHEPELMVIAFVEEAIQKAKDERAKFAGKDGEDGKDGADGEDGADGAKGKDGADGKDGGDAGGDDDDDDEETIIVLTSPYENYEDYLDRTYQGGGFYVSAREEDVSHEIRVTQLEVKVEKLTTTGPKRIVTWIFHAEGVDLAVQFEVLESAYPKHKATIQSALRSFRTIARTQGPLPTDARTDEGFFISISSMKKGTPAQRKEKRLASEMQLHARAKASLTPGWQARENPRFLILTNTDSGFADKVAESGAGLLGWLDEKLGFIGPDSYVRRPILRICATCEERDSMQRGVRGSDSWGFDAGHEILTCKDEYGSAWEIDAVNRELLDLWLRERDEDIWLGLPDWVGHGLDEYVAGARVAGRKLEFKNYQDEFRSFREVVQEKQNIPVRELVQMSSAQFYEGTGNYSGLWNRMSQADMVVRFLLSPEAGRAKQTKTLLFDYLRHLGDVVAELEGKVLEPGKEAPKEPTTEEEEEELYKKKHAAWQTSERERQVLDLTFQRAFAGWSQKDWEAFEKAFVKYAN